MSYDNFKRDFVSRTKEILETGPNVHYSVTNLINLCLGLIIMPDQFRENKLVDINKLETGQYGQLLTNTLVRNKDKGNSVLHHMRNAIAHGRIIQTKADKNGEIEELEFKDRISSNKCNFSMRMTIEQLKLFATDTANAYLMQYKKRNSADE